MPVLVDGPLQLWDSLVIAEYLMATYPNDPQEADEPLSPVLYRPASEWDDKLVMATVQTLGESIALISQMRWSGVTPTGNSHVRRNLVRVAHMRSWLEQIFLACHLMFAENRPLGISWRSAEQPRIAALCDRLQRRRSFVANPILWWEPGVVGYEDGRPIHA